MLKKILQDENATEEALLRVVRLLLQGIQQHAIEGDADDLGGFRMNIQRLTTALEDGITVSELLVQAGSALQTLEDYNRRTTRYLKRPAGEWQAVANMLISAIAGLVPAEERTVGRLREISADARSAIGLDEVHKVRLQLAQCLAELQLDTRHQKGPDIRNGTPPPTSAEAPAPPSEAEKLDGFGTRAQAEEALAAAWQSDPPSYVAVMAVDRLQIFNMRFGHSVGDEVLRFYGAFLRERLREGDRIFRWSMNTLLVLLPRPNRLEIVRDEVARLMEARCEHTVQTASRTILLPIASRWTVFPSMAAPRLLIHKIDAFAEMKGGKE
ncbi:MAG: diguanylate cyclase [Ignavibacteriota bacterium]